MRSPAALAVAALRHPLKWLPARTVLPVFSGPNRGMLWRAGASIPHCLTGSYEREKAEAVARALKPGMAAWDVGANAGYYTLLCARAVGPRGAVVAFEPLPDNAANVLAHARLNRLGNVTVVPAAAGGTEDVSPFRIADSNAEGTLTRGSSPLHVPCLTLDGWWRRAGRAPDVVKMDVEGAEADVLRGAARLLRRRRTVWFVAVHGPGPRRACLRLLAAAGYALRTLSGSADLRAADDVVALPPRGAYAA